MDEVLHQKAKFITFERPLLPSPPADAKPYWCLVNTLIFYVGDYKEVWRQEIPEAELWWVKAEGRDGDEFSTYFWPFEVFYEKGFGWQLRFKLSHERADYWLAKILEYVKQYHEDHFKETERLEEAASR